MSNHDCHQRVARNIERNSQTHVATALVKLARQLSVGNVKLTLENAKEDHIWQLTRQWHGGSAISSKSTGFQATISIRRSFGLFLIVSEVNFSLGILRKLTNNFLQLINTFASVIIVHGAVFCAEMSPLKAVNWAEITLFAIMQTSAVQKRAWTVCVPNSNFFVAQL